MQEPKYKITFIQGNPGLTIGGDTADDMTNAINEIFPVYESFQERVKPLQNTISDPDPKAIREDDSTPTVSCKECGSAMIKKSGTAKTGKQWTGWFCTADSKHKPEWG